MLKELQSRWAELLQGAVFLTAAVLLFVWKPPRLAPADDSAAYVHAAEFIGAILIVLVIVAARHGHWSIRRLGILTFLSIVGATVAFFSYRLLVGLWTCSDYDGRGPIVTGGAMLPSARKYAEQHDLSDCEMIQDVAGKTASIWPEFDLLARYLVLAGTFMLTVFLFVLAATLAIEIWRAASSRSSIRQGHA